MPVFDEPFVQTLERTNATRPASYRPDLHHFATSPSLAPLRDCIERTVAAIPEPGRTRLTQRLRSDELFVTATNEVAVAAVLHQDGLFPQWEPKFGNFTPDLFVPASADRPPIVCEVWTQQPKTGEPGRRRDWQALCERISKIPVPVGLVIVPRTRKTGPPTRQQAKEIGSELRNWLLSADRPSGAEHQVLGYRFLIAGASPDRNYAYLARPSEGGAVDTGVVLRIIREKTSHYRAQVHELGAAFMVVLSAQPDAPLDLGMVRAALHGNQAMSVLLPPAPVGPLADMTVQLQREHTVPELDPVVSVVGWVDAGVGHPMLHVFDNPRADIPLPRLDAPAITRERLPRRRC